MEEEYQKDYKIKEFSEQDKDEEIIRNLMNAKLELDTAMNNFEFAEADLIDYFAYQIKANQSKVDYLLSKAKKRGIILNMIEEKNLRSKKVI